MKIFLKYPIRSIHRLSGYIKSEQEAKHPAARLGLHWEEVAAACSNFVDGIDFNKQKESIDRYRTFLYECAELLESMIKVAGGVLSEPSKLEFARLHKILRDDVGYMVNKMKHNDYVLNPISTRTLTRNIRTLGFAFYAPSPPHGWAICQRTHGAECKAISLGKHTVKMLQSLFQLDRALDECLENDGIQPSVERSEKQAVADALVKCSRLSRNVFPDEQGSFSNVIDLIGNLVHIHSVTIPRIRDGHETVATYSGDGYTRSFPIPNA